MDRCNYTFAQIEMSKYHTRPKKMCQYREKCYRKNPIHFMEYSHEHLDKIFAEGVNPYTNSYNIPKSLQHSRDVISLQLQLMEKIFSPLKTPIDVKEIDENLDEKFHEKLDEKFDEKHDEKLDEKFNEKLDNIIFTCASEDSDLTSSSVEGNRPTNMEANLKKYVIAAPPDEIPILDETKGTVVRTFKRKTYLDSPKKLKKLRGTAEKLKYSAPYHFFLTSIADSDETHNEPLSITFEELLDRSLGEIEHTLHINFMVDIKWLLTKYANAGITSPRLLILHGDDLPDVGKYIKNSPISCVKVNMSTPFATHHSKMMLFSYKDGSMRIVVSTANLYADDWHNRTQGLWISPKLKKVHDTSDSELGESQTGFRRDLISYLLHYKLTNLQAWISKIRKIDFSLINVFFIGSVPGGFQDQYIRNWGHPRLGYLLRKHVPQIVGDVPIIAQSSSIGSLGPNIDNWIRNDFLQSLRKDVHTRGFPKVPTFRMIYPSLNNVNNSHDGLLGGGCLPYSKNVHEKQTWLQDHLYQWNAKKRFREKAMPHIKTYARWAGNELNWFVLTSANLSKAAWGAHNKNAKNGPLLRIMNYEAGILFLPQFIAGEKTLPLNEDRCGIRKFPLPYDTPLKPYTKEDKPFVMDYLRKALNGSIL